MHALRALQRRIITPDISATRMDTRGFHVKNEASKELLETVGKSFLTGYAAAVEQPTTAAAAAQLDQLPERFRGFAFEGAAMGYAVVGSMPFSGRRNLDTFLAEEGEPHLYMAYVGIGWAMARLPRMLWPKNELDPLLRWLVLDGYGFHQAYFKTAAYVRGGRRDTALRWPDGRPHPYGPNALDQGIGRALWFVGGTDPDVVAGLIESLEPARRPDLYSGAGLAATYAAGAEESELRGFYKRAGEYRPQVAQGSAFAAEARHRAGLVTEHTEVATEVFCGMTPAEAAAVCVRTRDRDTGPETAEVPAYEAWRRRIADTFVSLGRN
ncbi:DUF1702 family protein [Actinomadura flavalba]|uniref:DUF1702 family protein n=1 Tax=Actinomadura flavalba TaxID=1120938 RepID=UPI0003A7103A|nr:DUF1702 family protein [Actinomadura flavalba]